MPHDRAGNTIQSAKNSPNAAQRRAATARTRLKSLRPLTLFVHVTHCYCSLHFYPNYSSPCHGPILISGWLPDLTRIDQLGGQIARYGSRDSGESVASSALESVLLPLSKLLPCPERTCSRSLGSVGLSVKRRNRRSAQTPGKSSETRATSTPLPCSMNPWRAGSQAPERLPPNSDEDPAGGDHSTTTYATTYGWVSTGIYRDLMAP